MKQEAPVAQKGIKMPPLKPDQIEYLRQFVEHPPIDMDRVIGPVQKSTTRDTLAL